MNIFKLSVGVGDEEIQKAFPYSLWESDTLALIVTIKIVKQRENIVIIDVGLTLLA